MTDRIIPAQSTYDVPTFKLRSNGTDITNAYEVLSLAVDWVVNRVPTARIVLKDGSASGETFAASQSNDLIPGQTIEIAVGYDSRDRSIFKGLIVKQSLKVGAGGNSILTLDCKDTTVKLTIGRHSRYFKDSTDSNAIETILRSYSGMAKEIGSTRVQHPELIQYDTTDWDFVLSRVEMNGQILLADSGKLITKAPTISGSPLITLTYGANLLEFEAEMDARSQYQAAKAKSWNYTDQTLIEAEGAEPSMSSQGNLSGRSLAEVVGLREWELRHSGRVQAQELKAWADAQMLKSRLAKIQGRVKTRGYGDAKPDRLIRLEGVGDRFNGIAYVSGIRHEVRNGGWNTYMQLGLSLQWFYQEGNLMEPPASGLLPGVNGLQIGVVVQLQNDPTGEDRILVKSPTIDPRVEGCWARVAALDAGKNRGSFFRPEIGDEVVLGFLNDDPRDPIVLGMLNSSAKPAPLRAKDDNPQKGFFTRSKLKMSFDDEKKIITLETPGGNKVTISDDSKEIRLEDQNGNQLYLNDRGITLKSSKDITLEATGKITLKATQDASIEGLNVRSKARAKFEAQGSAGAEVSTSAIAILKGSLVKIN